MNRIETSLGSVVNRIRKIAMLIEVLCYSPREIADLSIRIVE
jgi:hypothetical protein